MNTNYTYSSPAISPLSQLGILLGLFGAGFLIGGIATLLIAGAVLHVPMLQLGDALNNSDNLSLLRWLQFAGTFIMFALPALVFARIVNGRPFVYMGFSSRFNYRQLLLVVLLVFAALYAQSMFAELNKMIPLSESLRKTFKRYDDEYTKQVMAMARMNNATDYILSLLMLALLPAIFEEMFFRGAMQQMFINLFYNAFAGILFTSIVFSVAHFSFDGFLTRLFLGLLLGYIFFYSKNIWLNILAHFLNNAVVVTGIYLLSRQGKLTTESMQDENYPLYIGALAVAAIFGLFVFFKRERSDTVPAATTPTSPEDHEFHIH